MAADHTAFVDQYIIELRDLTFNSKPIINTLTMLASENKAAGSGIADALERHIKLVSSAPTKHPPQLAALQTYCLPWPLMACLGCSCKMSLQALASPPSIAADLELLMLLCQKLIKAMRDKLCHAMDSIVPKQQANVCEFDKHCSSFPLI